jgi:hypothetical protein
MTWEQRAKQGLMQNTSKRRSGRSPNMTDTGEALGRKTAEGLTLIIDSICFRVIARQNRALGNALPKFLLTQDSSYPIVL